MEKHELAGKRIIVAGAGIAGLAFASALERYWPAEHPKPELILYERSAKILDRQKQGYTMSIKPESGLKALKELGLVDDALRDSNVGKDGTPDLPIVWNKDWQPMFDPNATSKKQIDQFGFPRNARLVRYKLRDLLLNALPTDTKVHWELGCASAQRLENGRTRVTLTDSTTEDCDLLVACDGANSSIRSSMLPNESLSYAGVVCFIGTSLFPNGKPDMFKNNWGLNITGKGLAFLVFPVDATTGAWGFSYKSDQPRDRIRGEEAIERRREILDEIQSRGRMIGEPFNQFVEATDPATLQVFSAMHKSPIVHAQKMAAANVVFIGDSNHPMSPFSGNGANMALMDAVALAQQLSNCTTVRKAISNFDAESAPRSQKAIDRGRFTIRLLHVKGIASWLFSAFLSLLGFLMRAMKRIR